MEKKRRARMNLCFDKLKELLLQSDIQQTLVLIFVFDYLKILEIIPPQE